MRVNRRLASSQPQRPSHEKTSSEPQNVQLPRRRSPRPVDRGAALRAQQAREKPDRHRRGGGKAGFYYLPLTISEQLGYFKAKGLDVEISDFAGGV